MPFSCFPAFVEPVSSGRLIRLFRTCFTPMGLNKWVSLMPSENTIAFQTALYISILRMSCQL
ncbi:hypothetical protein NEIFLAOT_00132 [Neisseria flavescens NRL30031/H210]|uniref:Uncharacterized protein n=1 Tax=Neisseria flavescens NRL30031/H210 TaxID=546264 RepID=C0EJP4_NEIFL|nr:hypothetical protein NEIFLAOT_00132 [Neisseria flavescens NRL30031/H210]